MTAKKEDVSTPAAVAVYGALTLAILCLLGSMEKERANPPQTGTVERVLDFEAEWRGLEKSIGTCGSRKVAPPMFGDGRLYWCVNGRAETAKLFINEDPEHPGKVLNVKVIWNEWKAHTPDAGADQREASHLARAVMKRYAPELEEDVLYAYWGNQGSSFVAEGLRFDYRWTPGLGIDEHLLTVTAAD